MQGHLRRDQQKKRNWRKTESALNLLVREDTLQLREDIILLREEVGLYHFIAVTVF